MGLIGKHKRLWGPLDYLYQFARAIYIYELNKLTPLERAKEIIKLENEIIYKFKLKRIRAKLSQMELEFYIKVEYDKLQKLLPSWRDCLANSQQRLVNYFSKDNQRANVQILSLQS